MSVARFSWVPNLYNIHFLIDNQGSQPAPGNSHPVTSITLLGLGMGVGGVILTFVLTCTLSAHYVDHVAWVGYGDGWGDVNVRLNLHAFCTLRRSRCLGWVWGWVG